VPRGKESPSSRRGNALGSRGTTNGTHLGLCGKAAPFAGRSPEPGASRARVLSPNTSGRTLRRACRQESLSVSPPLTRDKRGVRSRSEKGTCLVERRREPFLPPASVPGKGSSAQVCSARRTPKAKASEGSSPSGAVRGIDTRAVGARASPHECRSRQNALGLREACLRRRTGRKPGRRFRVHVNGSLLAAGNGPRERGAVLRVAAILIVRAPQREERIADRAQPSGRRGVVRCALSMEGTHDRKRGRLSRAAARTVSALSRARLWRGRHGSQKRKGTMASVGRQRPRLHRPERRSGKRAVKCDSPQPRLHPAAPSLLMQDSLASTGDNLGAERERARSERSNQAWTFARTSTEPKGFGTRAAGKTGCRAGMTGEYGCSS